MLVYFQNVRGLRTKLARLLENVCYSQYHVIVFNETWLTSAYHNSELHLYDYNVYRKDRSTGTSQHSRGGGVLIAVHKSIKSRALTSDQDIEQLFVLVGTGENRYIFGTAYFPPRTTYHRYVMFGDNLERLSEEFPQCKICILGDFNLPHGHWTDGQLGSMVTALPMASPNEVESLQIVSNMCSFHNLYQNNNVLNATDSILDLIFVHDHSIVVSPVDQPLLEADRYHPPLYFALKLETHNNNSDELRGNGFYRDFNAADFGAILDFLSQFVWDTLFLNRSLNEMLNIFYEILYLAIEYFVPLKKFSSRRFPAWFSPELKEMIVNKKIAHKQYLQSKSYLDYVEFSRLRSGCKLLKRQCYHDYVLYTEFSLTTSLKNFWKFVQSKRKKCNIPNEVYYDNIMGSCGEEIVDLFAEYFSEMYSHGDCNFSGNDALPYGVNLSSYNVSISDVYSRLSKLDVTKGPGPDGLPPSLLKHCSFILARPLFLIFNLSLSSGEFPSFWKTSFITPILKSGDNAQVTNYRPVSILSVIPKIFEGFVCDYLTSHLRSQLIDQQFGFMVGRSTELNILLFVESLSESLEEGSQVHALYTDFSKAFDRVNHKVLLHKLKNAGVNGPLLAWLETYLVDRTQIVRLNNFKSREILVPSGVPQGSHLGPLLFNIYINDIHTCFRHSSFLLFADDLKFYRTVSNINDCILLQSDLDRLVLWCSENGMDLNVKKCHSMAFSRCRNQINHVYQIDNTPLELVSQVRDLGVTLDNHLNFITHISAVVAKSLQLLGFIRRCSADFQSVGSIRLLYCSLVRPHLEYGSCVWSPYYQVHTRSIERVQHKFLKYVAFKQNIQPPFNYPELESILNLRPLVTRRRHRDLTVFYDILHSFCSCPGLLEKVGLHVQPRQTRQTPSFYVPAHRTNYGQNSFLTRTARLANQCSDILDCFQIRQRFLSGLRRHVT